MTRELPRIRISGDARTRSRRYGELAREAIHRTRDAYERVFEANGISWSAAIEQARSYLPDIEAHTPKLLTEIGGIAEGSGLPVEDVLAINCRTEILNAATAGTAAQISGECTAFALAPDRTAAGQAVMGQNWDWLEALAESTILLEVARDDGPNFVTLVEAGLLAKIVLTQSGLGVGVNTLVSSLDGGRRGIPFHFLLRSLADRSSIADVVEEIARLPRASSGNVMLASAGGGVLDVEFSPGGPGNVRAMSGEGGVIVHANHFLGPVRGGVDLAVLAMPDSHVRQGRMTRLVVDPESPCTEAGLRASLSDHVEHPSSICCHPNPESPPSDRWQTIASVILHPVDRRLAYTAGPPCSTTWHRLDYGTLLARGEAQADLHR